MIIGVGVDIVQTGRIRKSLERWGDRFRDRILNPAEVRSDQSLSATAAYLARQFAAKEAVSKALGTGMRAGVNFRDIKILRSDSGAPFIELENGALNRAQEIGAEAFHISISDEADYAIAYVIAENGE